MRLGDKVDLAKRLLSLSELSHKLQSFQELILPFAPPEVEGAAMADEADAGATRAGRSAGAGGDGAPEEYDEEDALMDGKSLHALQASAGKHGHVPPAHQSSCWTKGGSAVAPPDRLTNFYRRYNKVLLDNIAIEKEKERLQLENAQLQDLIQQFIDGTRLNESVLAEDNPLFVVNGRANLNHVPPVRQINPTVQEGLAIVSSTARQMVRR